MRPTAHHSTMSERRNWPLTCSLRPVILIVKSVVWSVVQFPDVIHDDGGKNVRLNPGMKDTAEVEAGGQHADHGYGAIVERNCPTDNRRIAGELPFPEGIAQQNRRPAAFDGLFGSEETPKLRLNAEHVKEVAGHPDAGQQAWFAAAPQFRIRRGEERYVGRHVLEGLVVASNLLVSIHAEGRVGEGAGPVVAGDPGQAARIMERQRAQQNGIDHAEDRDVNADAESEDQDRHDGECAIAAQGAQSKAQVLRDRGDPQRAPAFAAVFLYLAQAAEREASSTPCLLFRHAATNIFSYLLLEVKAHFLVQFQFQPLAAE